MPYYAILNSNTIAAHGTVSDLWPDTSFADDTPNPSFLADAGAVQIRSDAPYDPASEILAVCEPYVLDGEVFSTVATAIVAPTVEALKDRVTAERARRKEALTVVMEGMTFDADDESRSNLVGLLSAVSSGVPITFPVDWRDSDNVTRSLSQVQLVTLAGMMMGAVTALYDTSWTLKDVTIPALTAAERRVFDAADSQHWLVEA